MRKSRTHEIRLGIEVAAEDVIRVSLEGLHALRRRHVPNLQRLVVRTRTQQLVIR